jgi:iron complex transport system ATP-binding protein
MISLDKIQVAFGNNKALFDISHKFKPGALTVIIGPNGAGKSTLLRAMAQILPFQGKIHLTDGRELRDISMPERARRIAYLAQDRSIAWNMSAIEIAMIGWPSSEAEEGKRRAFEALMRLGLHEMAERGIHSFSGGQKSRVLLARLLASRSDILLLDEPLIALDPAWQREVLQIMRESTRQGRTVIMSLHDLGLALNFADELIVLDEGELVASGPPSDIMTSALLDRVFDLDARLEIHDMGAQLNISAMPSRVLGLVQSPLLINQSLNSDRDIQTNPEAGHCIETEGVTNDALINTSMSEQASMPQNKSNIDSV